MKLQTKQKKLYVIKGKQQTGPLDEQSVFQAIQNRTYSSEDLAWHAGMKDWQPLHKIYPSVHFPPPPFFQGTSVPSVPSVPAPPSPPVTDKKNLGDGLGRRMLLPVGRSPWAVAAGYLGIFSVYPWFAPIAILISIIAIIHVRNSKSSDHPKYGMGRAVFGLVMGCLGAIFWISRLWSI
jgi:hypothetical protein